MLQDSRSSFSEAAVVNLHPTKRGHRYRCDSNGVKEKQSSCHLCSRKIQKEKAKEQKLGRGSSSTATMASVLEPLAQHPAEQRGKKEEEAIPVAHDCDPSRGRGRQSRQAQGQPGLQCIPSRPGVHSETLSQKTEIALGRRSRG